MAFRWGGWADLSFAYRWMGWHERDSESPMRRAIGSAAMATCLMLLIVGATAQYITFAGLSQEIAMLLGILSALTTQIYGRARRPVVFIEALADRNGFRSDVGANSAAAHNSSAARY